MHGCVEDLSALGPEKSQPRCKYVSTDDLDLRGGLRDSTVVGGLPEPGASAGLGFHNHVQYQHIKAAQFVVCPLLRITGPAENGLPPPKWLGGGCPWLPAALKTCVSFLISSSTWTVDWRFLIIWMGATRAVRWSISSRASEIGASSSISRILTRARWPEFLRASGRWSKFGMLMILSRLSLRPKIFGAAS